MSKQHTPEPFELVVTTVPVVFEDSDKDDAYDKVDRHLRNSLGDTDYQEYSEALDKVADCSKLTEQRDDLLAALEATLNRLKRIQNASEGPTSYALSDCSIIELENAISSVKGGTA